MHGWWASTNVAMAIISASATSGAGTDARVMIVSVSMRGDIDLSTVVSVTPFTTSWSRLTS